MSLSLKKQALVTLISLSCFGGIANASEMNFPHINTTGYGKVTAKPDAAEFTVEVEAISSSAKAAKLKVDEAITDFSNRLLKAGVKRNEIQSANIILGPQYSYKDNKSPVLTGYRATRVMTVEVSELDKLNVYLDSALGDGINAIRNISLKVKDQESLKQAARAQAIVDANAKARSLANGFDMSLEGVWQINYQQNYGGPQLMRTMVMESAAKHRDSYSDVEIVVSDQVSVTYKLSNN